MAIEAFVSYSHADSKALDRLHKHLAMLKRDNLLNAWSDHKIMPGDHIANKINANLARSKLFIALLSADYLASNYCYEKEFVHAQELAASNRLKIVPIILEPCDWLSSPFGEFMALPKDGQPVSEWTNPNNAYLNIVNGLRGLIGQLTNDASNINSGGDRFVGRLPKIRKDFDAIQRSDFADNAFNVIRNYFKSACAELNQVGDNTLKAKFEVMTDIAFTCTVVNRSRQRSSDAHITIRNGKGRSHFGDIDYVYQKYADDTTSNGSIQVDADDYNLFLSLSDFYSDREAKYTAEQVAEHLWSEFVKKAGIDYE